MTLSVAVDDDDLDDTWFEEEPWMPEDSIEEEPLVLQKAREHAPVLPVITPSQFTSRVFMIPGDDGQGYAPFSFEGRRHLTRIYDTPAPRVLLMCGRQVEKSTVLGNRALCYTSLVTAMRVLYVSPSGGQTKTFSNDRIKEPIETSPILRRLTTRMLSQNVFEKQFINRSKITMRYAFLNADRTRGIPAWHLYIDEIQDILSDNIPVIEQCTSHAPDRWKSFFYSGTPKSLDNVIEDYRANKSTQGEWVVPCTGCTNWNVLGERNIGKLGPVCSRCGKAIDPQGERAQWAWMVQPDAERIKVPFESYRIPQLMVPWKIRNWHEIRRDYENYPRARFMNECLGISYESGTRPLTQLQLRAQCGTHSMEHIFTSEGRNRSVAQPYFFGVDWGSGLRSYTVLTIATYVGSRFRVLYMHRFVGEEAEPDVQINKIIELGHLFNVATLGVDNGYGFGLNNHLIRAFGVNRVHRYQHMVRVNKKLIFDPRLLYFKVHRTAVMSDIFEAIKKGKAEFPKWDEFHKPFGEDFTAIYSEENEKLHMLKYDHKEPDDSFHSFMYCWLSSMTVIKRPDIIAPSLEGSDGKPQTPYSGPTYQG